MTTATMTTASLASSKLSNTKRRFCWHDLDEVTKHSYINAKASSRIGERYAWTATLEFCRLAWDNLVLPRAVSVVKLNTNASDSYEIYCLMTAAKDDWKAATPTVVASSSRPQLAQKIVNLLRNHLHIKRLKAGFDFYADPRKGDLIRCSLPGEYVPHLLNPDSLCGAPIVFRSRHDSDVNFSRDSAVVLSSGDDRPVATLGGIIKVNSSYFALTAAHPITGSRPDSARWWDMNVSHESTRVGSDDEIELERMLELVSASKSDADAEVDSMTDSHEDGDQSPIPGAVPYEYTQNTEVYINSRLSQDTAMSVGRIAEHPSLSDSGYYHPDQPRWLSRKND